MFIIEIFTDMFNSMMNGHDWVFRILSGFMLLLMVGVAALLAFLVFALLQWIYILIFYVSAFGPVKVSDGKVTGMKYTAAYTTSSWNAATKTMQTQHHPEKNEVFFKTPEGETELDSDSLYQRVRIGDPIKVKWQKKFLKPRFWHGEWEYDSMRLLTVTAPTDESVEFNDEQIVTPEVRSK